MNSAGSNGRGGREGRKADEPLKASDMKAFSVFFAGVDLGHIHLRVDSLLVVRCQEGQASETINATLD